MNYKNVFDSKAGFMNGRFSNGAFRPGLNPFFSNHRRDDFCEGNAWQWTFFVPQDNEPSHHIAYMYNYVGQPWKTQRITNQILTTLYDNTPNGICGDEDTGQMSAWYVFSSMGFYPMNPASQKYDIGSPLFDEVVMKLENGLTFTVTATNLSKENIYIQSAKLNGNPLGHSFINYDDIIKVGKLEFEMGNKPELKWGKIN